MLLLTRRLERIAEQKREKIWLLNKVARLLNTVTPEMYFKIGGVLCDLIELGEVEWDSSSLALPRTSDIMRSLSNNYFLDEEMLNVFKDKALFRVDKKNGLYIIRDIHASPKYIEDAIIPILKTYDIDVEWDSKEGLMYGLTLTVKGEKEALKEKQ